MFLSFWTDRSEQTVQNQIRLLLEEGSDQKLHVHCLQFRLHLLDALSTVKPSCLNFRMITANFSGVQIFRSFTVVYFCNIQIFFSSYNMRYSPWWEDVDFWSPVCWFRLYYVKADSSRAVVSYWRKYWLIPQEACPGRVWIRTWP